MITVMKIDNKQYESPQLTVIGIQVEQGYAGSGEGLALGAEFKDESNDDVEDRTNSGRYWGNAGENQWL